MSNSAPSSPMQASLFSEETPKPVRLEIKGLIPSKKNNKMLVVKDPRGRPLKRPLLLTKPEYQVALQKIMESLRSQCMSACQTESGGTLTASSLRCWTALRLPADDSWCHIPIMIVTGELCEPGQEGATVTIERL